LGHTNELALQWQRVTPPVLYNTPGQRIACEYEHTQVADRTVIENNTKLKLHLWALDLNFKI